jgi:hypothetical protein
LLLERKNANLVRSIAQPHATVKARGQTVIDDTARPARHGTGNPRAL